MSARPRSYAAVVKAAERALRAARIDHVFVGAIAVMAFGEPRTTRDVDVIASYGRGDIPTLASEFRVQGFRASAGDLRDALSDGAHVTVRDTLSEYHLEVAPAVRVPAIHAIADARTVRWRGMSLPLASPEHTVVMKLVYGSEQDVEDAMRILQRNRSRLDLGRMREFARQRGVAKALRGLEQKAVEEDRRTGRRKRPRISP